MTIVEKYVNPSETAYRAWCNDCSLFVADTWDPFDAGIAAHDHQKRQLRKHHIVMYTDNTATGFTGLEGND